MKQINSFTAHLSNTYRIKQHFLLSKFPLNRAGVNVTVPDRNTLLTSLDLRTPKSGYKNAGTNAAAPRGTASDTQYTAVTIST